MAVALFLIINPLAMADDATSRAGNNDDAQVLQSLTPRLEAFFGDYRGPLDVDLSEPFPKHFLDHMTHRVVASYHSDRDGQYVLVSGCAAKADCEKGAAVGFFNGQLASAVMVDRVCDLPQTPDRKSDGQCTKVAFIFLKRSVLRDEGVEGLIEQWLNSARGPGKSPDSQVRYLFF